MTIPIDEAIADGGDWHGSNNGQQEKRPGINHSVAEVRRRDGERRVLSYGDVSSFVFIDEDIDDDGAVMDRQRNEIGAPPELDCHVDGDGDDDDDDVVVVVVDAGETSAKLNARNVASGVAKAAAAADKGTDAGGDKENRRGHLLGRIYRRMRKCSMGWSKTGRRVRRGDLFCVISFFHFFLFFRFWLVD